MNKKIKLILSIIMLLSITQGTYAQVKLAQTGLKFLSIGGDARAAAMADAVTSIEGNSAAIFYNPAGMARQTALMDVTFANTMWIADIKYINASLSFAPSEGLYGVFGISLASVDYGKFNKTIRISDSEGADSYLDLGTYSPSALAIGLTYAKALSDKFSVGGNIKYAYQDLGDGQVVGYKENGSYKEQNFDINVLAFDFGLLYHTGFKSLSFGMSLRNFSEEIRYVEENFQLPLTFKLGLSMNVLDFFSIDKHNHSLLFSIDAAHPRDYKEQIHIGGEYTFFDVFSIRAGYVTPTDEQGINAGVGLKYPLGGINLGIDYAYLDFGIFDSVHRFTINVSY